MINDDVKKSLSILINNGDFEEIKFIRENMHYIRFFSQLLNEELYKVYDENTKYNKYYSLYNSISISENYFNSINKKYNYMFNELLNNGRIQMVKRTSNKNGSYVIGKLINGQYYNNVMIEYNNTIEDMFSIVHEFFHTTNCINNNFKLDRLLLTESVSIFYEFLLSDYLKDNNFEEYDLPIKKRINNIINDSNNLNNYLDNIYVGLNNLSIIESINYNENEIYKMYNYLLSSFKYTLSSFIAIVMYYDYKRNRITLNNIESYNNSLSFENNLISLRHILLCIPDKEYILDSLNYFKDRYVKVYKKL